MGAGGRGNESTWSEVSCCSWLARSASFVGSSGGIRLEVLPCSVLYAILWAIVIVTCDRSRRRETEKLKTDAAMLNLPARAPLRPSALPPTAAYAPRPRPCFLTLLAICKTNPKVPCSFPLPMSFAQARTALFTSREPHPPTAHVAHLPQPISPSHSLCIADLLPPPERCGRGRTGTPTIACSGLLCGLDGDEREREWHE
eukprot:scaffold22004_cov92-Isochrysis_galbana.AAC.4